MAKHDGDDMAAKKILVVDDDRDFLESLQLVIFEQGHQVHPVSNGLDAVAQYKKLKPDIVFLDVKMPGIDGYETFVNIRRHDPEAKVVFMSGYTLDVLKYTEVERFATGTINKPVRHEELKKIIKKYTGTDGVN